MSGVRFRQLLPVLCIALFFGCQQKQEETEDWEFVRYDKRQTLEWKDFKGAVDIFSEYDAITHSRISSDYDVSIENSKRKIKFDIYVYFGRYESWAKENSRDNWILQHEQLHFDITELNARLLRQKLATYEFTENYKSEINDLRYRNRYDWQMMQDKYDEESEHSTNADGQEKWNRYVKEKLAELETYSNPTVVNEQH